MKAKGGSVTKTKFCLGKYQFPIYTLKTNQIQVTENNTCKIATRTHVNFSSRARKCVISLLTTKYGKPTLSLVSIIWVLLSVHLHAFRSLQIQNLWIFHFHQSLLSHLRQVLKKVFRWFKGISHIYTFQILTHKNKAMKKIKIKKKKVSSKTFYLY